MALEVGRFKHSQKGGAPLDPLLAAASSLEVPFGFLDTHDRSISPGLGTTISFALRTTAPKSWVTARMPLPVNQRLLLIAPHP